MTDQFEISYWETLTGNPMALGFVIGALILFAIIVWLKVRPKRQVEADNLPRTTEEKKVVSAGVEAEKNTSILGTGTFKCMAFRQGNVLDFTTIPEPIGEVYFFDPTCPMKGAGYIVREAKEGEMVDGIKRKKGEVVDYDPRQIKVKIKESPEYAHFATHWDIVPVVFKIALNWWQTRSVWFAAGMMGILLLATLVVLDK